MKKFIFLIITCTFFFSNHAQSQTADYLNPSLSINARVKDLVSKLTLEEKVFQMIYNAPAIPRLNIPEYNWWNEALHEVGSSGPATVFQQKIVLAATFIAKRLKKLNRSKSLEARMPCNS